MPKIIKFKDNSYGIRKRNLFHKIFFLPGVFRDLTTKHNIKYRKINDPLIYNCKSDYLGIVTMLCEKEKNKPIEKLKF